MGDQWVTAGTSIDITFGPHPLTQKEDLLLLSLWRRHCHVPKGCALGTWLKGINKELGPDNEESPHKVACPLNVAHPAGAYNVRSTVGLEFLNKLPPSIPFNRCVTTELRLLITAFEIENMDLGVLVSVLLAGVIPDNFPFFFSGCCMAQRRSLSGRSPFCQRKLSDSRKFNGNFVP